MSIYAALFLSTRREKALSTHDLPLELQYSSEPRRKTWLLRSQLNSPTLKTHIGYMPLSSFLSRTLNLYPALDVAIIYQLDRNHFDNFKIASSIQSNCPMVVGKNAKIKCGNTEYLLSPI